VDNNTALVLLVGTITLGTTFSRLIKAKYKIEKIVKEETNDDENSSEGRREVRDGELPRDSDGPGVAGAVTTAVLASKAGYSSALKIQAKEHLRVDLDEEALETKEKIKLVWKRIHSGSCRWNRDGCGNHRCESDRYSQDGSHRGGFQAVRADHR
jgi:hypothetical protein